MYKWLNKQVIKKNVESGRKILIERRRDLRYGSIQGKDFRQRS